MANINNFREFVFYVMNKNQVGNSLTIPEFNSICNRSQMQVFEKDRAIFVTKQEVSDFLGLFLKNKTTSVPASGVFPYPSDLEHIASIRSYYVRPEGKSVEILVQPVKNRDWGEVSSSQLQTPTKRFPKYTEFGEEFRFLPMNIGIVMIDYFKTPVAPVWGYTIVNGRPVYDSASSVDFEWSDFAFNNVAANFLSLVGCNLKDTMLEQFAEQYKSETNSVL